MMKEITDMKEIADVLMISFFMDLMSIKEEKGTTGKIGEESKGILKTHTKVLNLLGLPDDIIEEVLKNSGISQEDLKTQECQCACVSKLSNEDIYKRLSAEQREYVSGRLRMEHVKEDVKNYIAEDASCVIPDAERKDAIAAINSIADKVATQFVKECKYDCNSSYWVNIERLTVKAWKEVKRQS